MLGSEPSEHICRKKGPEMTGTHSPRCVALILCASVAAMIGIGQESASGDETVFVIIDGDSIDNGTNCSDAGQDGTPGCVSIEECAFGACPGVSDPPIENDPSVLVNDDRASIPGVQQPVT